MGLQGWGKTALTTGFGILANNMGWDIYSNYPLKNIPYTYFDTVKEAQNIRWGYILFDEFWEWVHARTHQSKINKLMMEICLLNRKRGNSIIYNTQLPRTIDVILKEVTNYRYIPFMIKHSDNKKYVHYIQKDILGREYPEMFFPMSIDELGKCFDTHFEVKKPGLNNEDTPLNKGITLEKDFAKAIKKIKGVKYVDVLPNSGHGSSWLFDVIVYTSKGVYAFDVKGSSKTHIYLQEYGDNIIKKINNAREHKAFSYLAFPNNKFIRMGLPGAWYIHRLTENDYLKRLNSMPFYNKLVKNSQRLIDINFIN